MIKRKFVTTIAGHRVLLTDSVSFVTSEDSGAIVVCASHGGESSGHYAVQQRPGLIFFNDAGIGKEGAGIRALDILEARGIPAATVSSQSARIGDVIDHWQSGRVSRSNRFVHKSLIGASVEEAIDTWALLHAHA